MKLKEILTKFYEGSFEHIEDLWVEILLSLAVAFNFTLMAFAITPILHPYNSFWIFPILFAFSFFMIFGMSQVGCGGCF